ncbi:MAG: small-conductance mechanosensitive ion channel [Chitinophagaceae bacterium]|nr:small-conductance mechanosensitive ion channel [Rubrivivax sp.]
MNTITDFGAATMASVSLAMASLFAAIPRILAFALILLIGWFVASLIEKAVASLLRAVKFNDLAARAGFTGFVQKMGVGTDASGFLALIAKWFIRLIVLVVAFDALGLPAVSDVLRQMLLWLPNLVVAMVVLVVGGLAADALGKVVRGATAQGGFTNPDLLGKIAKVAVWAFSIIVAVNQLGIATTLVNTMVMATFGSVALALGLAFGMGGRDTAAELVAGWRQAAKDAEPKVKAAAEAVQNTSTPGAASSLGMAQSAPSTRVA